MNIKVTKAAVPPCCANCRFNNWQESGPSCAHPAHWDDSQFEIDTEDNSVFYCGEDETAPGEVDWDDVCEHHQPGRFWQLESKDILKALVDQRCAEIKAKLTTANADGAVEA